MNDRAARGAEVAADQDSLAKRVFGHFKLGGCQDERECLQDAQEDVVFVAEALDAQHPHDVGELPDGNRTAAEEPLERRQRHDAEFDGNVGVVAREHEWTQQLLVRAEAMAAAAATTANATVGSFAAGDPEQHRDLCPQLDDASLGRLFDERVPLPGLDGKESQVLLELLGHGESSVRHALLGLPGRPAQKAGPELKTVFIAQEMKFAMTE